MIWLAFGLGCIWHGGQIIWVAPTPRFLQKISHSQKLSAAEEGEIDPARAFQLFWLDQYAWIGITLVVVGLVCCVVGVT